MKNVTSVMLSSLSIECYSVIWKVNWICSKFILQTLGQPINYSGSVLDFSGWGKVEMNSGQNI